jgi:hypothetical protein
MILFFILVFCKKLKYFNIKKRKLYNNIIVSKYSENISKLFLIKYVKSVDFIMQPKSGPYFRIPPVKF